MTAAVETAGVPNMVWYNYRRVPAVVLLKHLIDEGRFGRIFHYRAKFLQDWTISQDLPQGGEGLWRLDVNVAGSGVTGDLAGPHHRYRALAERTDRRSLGHDRDLHQRTQTQFNRAHRARRYRRCQRISLPLPQRLAGDV